MRDMLVVCSVHVVGLWHVLLVSILELCSSMLMHLCHAPLIPFGGTDVVRGAEINYEHDFYACTLTLVCGPRDCSYELFE